MCESNRRWNGLVAVVLSAAALLWLAPASAMGQGDGRGGGGKGRNPPPPPKASPPTKGHCTLRKYAPAKDRAGDDAPLGMLSVHMNDNRNVRLTVPPDFKMGFGSKQFGGEELEHLLINGIGVDVSWKEEAPPRRVKILETVTMKPIDVNVEVEKYDEKDGVAVVRAWPKDGTWPEDKAPPGRGPPGKPGKPGPPPKQPGKPAKAEARTLRLKAIESVSAVEDESQRVISLADLQKGQKLRGSVVLGKPCGLVEKLSRLAEGAKFDDVNSSGGGPGGR